MIWLDDQGISHTLTEGLQRVSVGYLWTFNNPYYAWIVAVLVFLFVALFCLTMVGYSWKEFYEGVLKRGHY